MIDYTTLKHREDGVTTWDGFLGVMLKVAHEKESWKRNEIVDRTLEEVNFPSEMKELRYPGKWHDLVLKNHAEFALSDLTIAGLLSRPRRGEYQITDLGRTLYQKYGINITRTITHSTKEFLEHDKRKRDKSKNTPLDNKSEAHNNVLSEQEIQDWIENELDSFQDLLLEKMSSMNPYKFEHLMIQLLSVMGYQGDNGQSLVTQKSNDGGIDGVINQDPLGLQKVYVQVKRYAENNSVGRPEIAGFSGAIKLKHANRGVFITTSSFTSGAVQAARDLDITLVDGEMLTNLMVKYGVGVEVKKQYRTYRINADDFIE